MKASERFLSYVKVHTTSDPSSSCAPSSAIQFDLAHMLVKEMTGLGLENAHVDEYGVVYGWLPATAGMEAVPALGFIAHMARTSSRRSSKTTTAATSCSRARATCWLLPASLRLKRLRA